MSPDMKNPTPNAVENTDGNNSLKDLILPSLTQLTKTSYDKGMTELYYIFEDIAVRNYDNHPTIENDRLANLLERLARPAGAGYTQDVHANLNYYVANSLIQESYVVPHNDPTLVNFLAVGVALDKLLDLRISNEILYSALTAAIEPTAEIWLNLGDKLYGLERALEAQLDKYEEDLGIDNNDGQYSADDLYDDDIQEDDRTDNDDDTQDEVEDVANWGGATGGNWT